MAIEELVDFLAANGVNVEINGVLIHVIIYNIFQTFICVSTYYILKPEDLTNLIVTLLDWICHSDFACTGPLELRDKNQSTINPPGDLN